MVIWVFNRTYGYVLRKLENRRGYWGKWYYRARYEKVLEHLSKHPQNGEEIILELGCGYGSYAKYLTEMGCDCSYVGCDVDHDALLNAHRESNIDYVLCDMRQLPFRERAAHLVVCSEVLEHLTFPYEALLNICDAAILTVIVTFPKERVLSVFGDRHPEHVSDIDQEKVIVLLASRKFKVLQASHIFSSFIPCGVLEFFGIPRNRRTQAMVDSINRLLKKITPSPLVPHKTILIEAERLEVDGRKNSDRQQKGYCVKCKL
jgi:SAM-dependent methyltransferase